MTTTLTLIVASLAWVAVCMYLIHLLEERSRRRDREIVRRIHTMLANQAPRRPW